MLSPRALAISVTFIFILTATTKVFAAESLRDRIWCERQYKKAFDYYRSYDKEVGYLPSHEEAVFHRDYYNLKFKAFAVINNLLKKNHRFARGYYLRARLWSKFCYDDARELKVIPRGIDEKDFPAWLNLRILANYNAAVKCDRGFADSYIGLFNFYSGRDNKKAIIYLNKAIALGYAPAYWERAWFNFFRKNHKQAKADMDMALKLDPENSVYYKGRAEVEWYLKNERMAIGDIIKSGCVSDKLDTDISENDYRNILKLCLNNWAPPVNSIEVVDPETVRVDIGARNAAMSCNKNIVATYFYRQGEWREKTSLRLEREF
jgi:tetratricopeptide (TPR) repeat protein